MIIGVFSEKEDGRFVGPIESLLIKIDKAVFEPLNSTTDNSPSHRIYTSADLEIGAAWRQVNKETGEISYSVLIDDPTLASPIRCGFVPSKEAATRWLLIWNRSPAKAKERTRAQAAA